jgi:hypothetical protein
MDSTFKKEIYSYEAPWLVYGMNWSVRDDPKSRFRLAIGSFVEEYNNQVEVGRLSLNPPPVLAITMHFPNALYRSSSLTRRLMDL